jgi:hypothetical protein
MVVCAGITFGTTPSTLCYLIAMTHELSNRSMPVTGGIDQGIHNDVVCMHLI